MKRIAPGLSLLMSLVCHAGFALASPTSNEFELCHKMAASVLQHCLDQREGNCWDQSKKVNDSCYDRVYKSHRPDKDMIEAKKAAEKAAMERALREKEAATSPRQ